MANEFIKPTSIKPAILGTIANPDDYNQNIAGQSKDNVLFIDVDGNFADGDVGNETVVANGSLIADLKYRNTGNIKVYNSSGMLQSTTPISDIISPSIKRNLIINGQGSVAQRLNTELVFDSSVSTLGRPLNNDDTYLLDRMLLLSDGNNIVDISQEFTLVPTGSYSSIKFDQETANKQWAYVQIIEGKDSASVIGGKATISFKARKGSSNVTAEILRAAIISWNSTEDVVTSDVVGTWNGSGTDPTLATNWTYENTPINLGLTDSFQTFVISDVSIDTSSTKNVAVFIWLDDEDATVADTVYITDIKLEEGPSNTSFEARSFAEELAVCQRYAANLDFATGEANSTTSVLMSGLFPQELRVNAISYVQTDASISVTSRILTTSGSGPISFPNNVGKLGGRISISGFTGLATDDIYLIAQSALGPFVRVEAEL